MKRLISVLLLAGCISLGTSARKEDVNIVFWNLENFFDYIDRGQGDADHEFSFSGKRRWTRKRFLSKCLSVSKGICYISDICESFPDVIGVAEVENRFALRRLLDRTSLDKVGYDIVHFDSPDRRGIDVALLYRRSRVQVLNSRPLRLERLCTRDILLADCIAGGDTLTFAVCHLPSKFGGGKDSARAVAVSRLRRLRDSLSASGRHFVFMGDFNEEAAHPSFSVLTSGDSLVNLAARPAARGEGTIRFRGRWEMIDLFFVSPSLAPFCSMRTVKIPFLMQRDNVHAGMKPKRTYVGPRYNGGVSDHLPVLLQISAREK